MPHLLKKFLLPICLLLVVACIPGGEVTIIDAWARPANLGDNSAIYLKINNPGPRTDSLIEVDTDVAAQAELHQSEMDDLGVMSMHHQNHIDIPPDSQIEFAPGGLHVMLIDLEQDLQLGDSIQVTFKFQNSDDITLDIPIKQP
jgi:copper(I)-binding protein